MNRKCKGTKRIDHHTPVIIVNKVTSSIVTDEVMKHNDRLKMEVNCTWSEKYRQAKINCF